MWLISCDRRPGVFVNIQEHVYDMRVKLSSGQVADRLARRLERRSTPVGPVGCNGVKSVHDGEDSSAKKNLFSFEPAWIAAAVVAFVVGENNFRGVGKKRNILHDIEPDLYMLLHEFPLALGEGSRLYKNGIG